ncbi:MAG: hypothetical protein HYX24_03215 [Candidatus Aenigmarchaeota archaeon]|nr:hypothetical protein [Candidatus Aenigmarchaeota archaeon]
MVSLFAKKDHKISSSTLKVLRAINSRWPANSNDIARELGEDGNAKAVSAKYLYHLKKLERLDLIQMKRMGNTYVAWPTDIEKLRVIHEMVRG